MASVVLGMSGGVDSCAAAIILKEKGYDVVALYFDVLPNGNPEGLLRAKTAAKSLGLDFVYKDISKEFNERIIKYFCSEYCKGNTPTPCVFCNPLIKFNVLSSLDTDYIASGHYADIVFENGTYFVKIAANEEKDQSYMLARLPQDILQKTIFPLAEIKNKDETRNFVSKYNIEIAGTKDSQDICFVNGSYKDFLRERSIDSLKGNFINEDGKILGPHKGIANYTIGQRKGLGIALGEPAFIKSIDSVTGDIVLSTDESCLMSKEVYITNLLLNAKIDNSDYFVKLRYAAKPAKCKIRVAGDEAKLIFEDSQRAPTPGQAAVIYRNNLVIGSGIIYNKML